MFFLPLDVAIHLRNHRFAHRKCAVSFLPREGATFWKRSRNPGGGVCLHLTDHFRHGFILTQLRQDMDMIRGPVDDQRNSVFAPNRAAEVLMNPWTNRSSEPRLAGFGRKDDMVEQVTIGRAHGGRCFPSPPSGGSFDSNHIPGVPLRSTPGFNSGALFERSETIRLNIGHCTISATRNPQRHRRGGIEPGVQRSETPGTPLQQRHQPLTRGDGPMAGSVRRAGEIIM